jgi:hypothetical protein
MTFITDFQIVKELSVSLCSPILYSLSPPLGTAKLYRIGGGAKEDRTPDLLRARQALSQLSYGPNARFLSPSPALRISLSLYAMQRWWA